MNRRTLFTIAALIMLMTYATAAHATEKWHFANSSRMFDSEEACTEALYRERAAAFELAVNPNTPDRKRWIKYQQKIGDDSCEAQRQAAAFDDQPSGDVTPDYIKAHYPKTIFVMVLAEMGILGLLYLLPMMIAQIRQHSQRTTITVINLFLGWTLLGWVVALAWAVSYSSQAKKEKPIVILAN